MIPINFELGTIFYSSSYHHLCYLKNIKPFWRPSILSDQPAGREPTPTSFEFQTQPDWRQRPNYVGSTSWTPRLNIQGHRMHLLPWPQRTTDGLMEAEANSTPGRWPRALGGYGMSEVCKIWGWRWREIGCWGWGFLLMANGAYEKIESRRKKSPCQVKSG